MIQVRLGIFETNSSSTHNLVVCTDEELDKWKRGELSYDGDTTLVEACENDPDTVDYAAFGEDLDIAVHQHELKNGDIINIVCRYGYDG